MTIIVAIIIAPMTPPMTPPMIVPLLSMRKREKGKQVYIFCNKHANSGLYLGLQLKSMEESGNEASITCCWG